MMWQATSPVDLVARFGRAAIRRAPLWHTPGVSWQNG